MGKRFFNKFKYQVIKVNPHNYQPPSRNLGANFKGFKDLLTFPPIQQQQHIIIYLLSVVVIIRRLYGI